MANNEQKTVAEFPNLQNKVGRMVCAWCNVYCREERECRNAEGRLVSSYAVCAYCGRPELSFTGE